MNIDSKIVLIGLLFSTTIIFSVISGLYFDRFTHITEDYNTLSSDYGDIESELQSKIVEKNDLVDQLSKLTTDVSALENSIDSLQGQKNSLQSEINKLNNEKIELESEKTKLIHELSSEEETSQELLSIVEQYKAIPSTPAISDLDFKLYGGDSGSANQILIEYPSIHISGIAGTGSMSPGISSQSTMIQTSIFNHNTLTPGQIIVYTDNNGNSILHRIHSVKLTPSDICYETKGDANFYLDSECIKPEQIEKLVLGVLFRGIGGQYEYCSSELNFGPSSNYCPSN